MNGVNGIGFAKDGTVYLKKKQVQRYDDPELEAEVRYAKENGLEIPKKLASVEDHPAVNERKPQALSQRNRSKSTSDVKQTSPKLKMCKADRKARSRGVSGTYSRKDDKRFEYGLEDYFGDEFDDDLNVTDLDEAIQDDYEDVVFTFDAEKVRGALEEYYSNGSCECALSELTVHLYNNDSTLRVTKEVIRSSLDYDNARVVLGYNLMAALLKNKFINEKVIAFAIEENLHELESTIKDCPRAREFLALFIAKTVSDGIMARLVFDDITSKLNHNRQAMSCALEVYTYLNNRPLLRGKFEPAGGYEPLNALHDQMEKILREFLLSEDAAEVVERLRHLHVIHFHHELVYLTGHYAMEKMHTATMEKLANLLKHLLDVGFLPNESCIKPGFHRLYKSINDLCIDLPAAYTLCDLWVQKCKKHGVIDEALANEMPKPSAKRARTLSQGDDGKLSCIEADTQA
ncbi:Programmed cell death protein 4 [Aphelenchoides fujianensis]|nr:Programmed cell death protein 4 [Aphelenchoides fujianensis]